MTASPAMGRPKIEGLKSLNVRLLGEQIAALDAVVAAEQKRRGDPGFNRTDALREAVAAYVAARAAK
jgi:hypothetical protein